MLLFKEATGCAMMTFWEDVHPRASVTVQVHDPAGRSVALALLWIGVVFHAYANGDVPPTAITLALPVAAPKHPTFVCPPRLLVKALEGSVMVTVRVVEHPFASVMVHVHVPADRLVAAAVFWTGAVFQLKA